jgi:hypothetical protein
MEPSAQPSVISLPESSDTGEHDLVCDNLCQMDTHLLVHP